MRLFYLFFIFCITALAQTNTWELEDFDLKSCHSAFQSYDNGLVQLVSTQNNARLIKKTDQLGNDLWSLTINPEGSAIFGDVKEFSNGDILLAGSTNKYELQQHHQDVYMTRINNCGDTVWFKTYGETNRLDYFVEMLISEDDIYAIFQNETSFSQKQIIINKYNGDGDLVWEKSVFYNGDPSYPSMLRTKDGGFLITARDYYSPFFNLQDPVGYIRAVIIKTDSLANTEWTKVHRWEEDTITQIYASASYETIELVDSSFITTAIRAGWTFNSLILYKTDSQGNEIWNKTIDSVRHNGPQKIILLNDSTILFANRSSQQLEIYKADTAGNILSCYKDTIYTYGYIKELFYTTDDKLLIQLGGRYEPYLHYYTMKFDPITMQPDTFWLNDTTSYDYLCPNEMEDKTITFPASTIGLNEIQDIHFEIAPNPVKDIVSISLDQQQIDQIRLVDISGRIVDNYAIENSDSSIELHLGNQSPGIYLLELIKDGNILGSEKVIIQ